MATELPDTAARVEGEWTAKVAEEWEPPRAVVLVAWVDRAGGEDPRAVVEAWAVLVAAEDRAVGPARAGLDLAESLRSMGRWKTDNPAKEARLRRAETQVRPDLPDKADEDRAGRWAWPRLLSL